MVLLFTISQAVYATTLECPNFHQKVRLSKDSLWIGDVVAMEESLQAAHAALDCSKTLNMETIHSDLGDFFLLNAYGAHLTGHYSERTWWLQQSYNLGHWNSNFGPEIETLRNDLTETKLIPVSVLPDVDLELTFVVDGVTKDYLEVSEGLHWIEIHNENELLIAQLLNVQGGSFIQLPEPVLLHQSTFKENRRIGPWFASAVFFSSVALSTHVVAMLNHQQYGGSTSLSQLEAQRLRTWRWGQASLVSSALALGALSRWTLQEIRSQVPISEEVDSSLLE